MSASETQSSREPPYSTGITGPSRPSSAMPSMMPMSRWWLMSFSCATGMMRRSTNSRTVSWIASWSSVRSRFKATPWKLAANRLDPRALRCVHASAGGGQPAVRLTLGAVHRLVCRPEQRLRFGALLGADGDPKADRELPQKLLAAVHHRVMDPFGHGARLVPADLGQDQRELIAADPVDPVHLAAAVHQHPAQRLQRAAASRMAALVVDLLEPVDIAHEQREPPSVAIGAGRLERELAHEAAPVPEPSERVMVRQELHLLELRGGVQRGRCLIRKHTQGLQTGRRGYQ